MPPQPPYPGEESHCWCVHRHQLKTPSPRPPPAGGGRSLSASVDRKAVEKAEAMGAHEVGLRAAAARMRRIPRPVAAAIAVRHAYLRHRPDAVAADILSAGANGVAGP